MIHRNKFLDYVHDCQESNGKWHQALISRHLIVTYLRTKASFHLPRFNLKELAKTNLAECTLSKMLLKGEHSL